MKILSEISGNTGIKNLREDNILFLISVKLKDLANLYGIFIMSSTQLNEGWKYEKIPDQNLLRGSKAIADRVDVGMIVLNVTQEDIECLKSLIDKGFPKPDKKISFYKVRRGKYNRLFLWARSNLGTCRIDPMFATTYDYEPIQIEDLKIEVEDCINF